SFIVCMFFFSSRRRHTRSYGDWSSDVCSSDLEHPSAHGFLSPMGAETMCRWMLLFGLMLLAVQARGPRASGDARLSNDTAPNWRSEERRVGKGSESARWRESGRERVGVRGERV